MRWEITGQPGSHREVSLGIQVKGSAHTPGALGTRGGDRESLAKTNPVQTRLQCCSDAERKQTRLRLQNLVGDACGQREA